SGPPPPTTAGAGGRVHVLRPDPGAPARSDCSSGCNSLAAGQAGVYNRARLHRVRRRRRRKLHSFANMSLMGLARDPGRAHVLPGPGEPAFSSATVEPPRSSRRMPAAWNEILAMVAHDLRNPLNAISLAATLTLESTSARDEETARRMETILRASGRMNRLIGDLLDAVVLEAGVLTLELRSGSA